MFTTNYDRCIEAFWRENVQVTPNTGFRSKNVYMSTERTLSADEFLEPGSKIQALKNSSSHFRLVKLHGSTTWLKREDTGKVEELIFHLDQGKKELGTAGLYMSEAVIHPLRQKKLYVNPYIQMFYLLNKELALRKVWIVIGYSFRDPVIQNIFNTNFRDGKKMILIHPHPDEVRKRFPSNAQENIIDIERHFGRKDEENHINETLKSEITKLSNQP